MGAANVIEVTGRFISDDNNDELNNIINKYVSSGEKNFLIDLSGVTFISSTGVGSLIQALRLIQREEGQLKLLNPSQCVRQIIAISKLDDIFEIYTDEQTAIMSFDQPPKEDSPKKRKKKTE